MPALVGRQPERRVLDEAQRSSEPELVAVYGRRRVGKTFLIREVCGPAICFELVGIDDGDLSTQLAEFATVLAAATGAVAPLRPPSNWHGAFAQLADYLTPRLRRRKQKQVVFFDEVPWLASRRSGFLSAFGHFWNTWASKQPRLVIVLCGSAASWMLQKIVRDRGGLHNRVTRRIRVEPFSLADTAELLRSRGVELGPYQTTELYIAMGGIPHYLAQVRAGESAAQNIDRLCFARDGLLRGEFSNLYASLFERAERHEAVVRALASRRRGLTRAALLSAASLGTGGAATKVLDELEESGFIMQMPRLGRARRDALYWLADEYSLFYLTWIEQHRAAGDGVWMRKQGTPAWRAWAGLAFEATCLKHVPAIKRALGIAGVETVEGSWHQPAGARTDGAQIDLVIDRSDRSVNLCEIKFCEAEFVVDKACARELARKRDVFRAVTRTRKALFVTLVTTYGVRDNEHARGLVSQVVTLDSLFR
ncbi:MAG TPA: ATP-binding protein [Kofleriaceae bacterium]|nr:ATP-binding protein [Kofleriaceae bacterium]